MTKQEKNIRSLRSDGIEEFKPTEPLVKAINENIIKPVMAAPLPVQVKEETKERIRLLVNRKAAKRFVAAEGMLYGGKTTEALNKKVELMLLAAVKSAKDSGRQTVMVKDIL